MRVIQIPKEDIIDHLRDEDLYMVTFSEKLGNPSIKRVATQKLSDIFEAECFVKFEEDA